MSLTYTWKIERIGRKSTSTIENAIVQTHWTLTGTNSDGVSGTFTGATPFKLSTVDPTNFVSYENLTEETVLEWIKNVVNSDLSYKEHIDSKILEEIADVTEPTTEVTSGFPWQDGVDEVTPPVPN